MTARASLPRPQRSRNAAAAQRRARQSKSATAKAQRAALREKLGSLRDRVMREATRRRCADACREFFRWVQRTGRAIPSTHEEFDALCCAWAVHLWHEGLLAPLSSMAMICLKSEKAWICLLCVQLAPGFMSVYTPMFACGP